jgi:hypothetical protein
MKKANWVYKPEWFPFGKASTTLFNTVYVGPFFDKFSKQADFSKCSHCIHETQHLMQYDKLRHWTFLRMYATKEGRYSLERGAFRQEIFWMIRNNRIIHPDHVIDKEQYIKSHDLLMGIANSLHNNYETKISYDEILEWIEFVWKEGFNLGYHVNT